MLGSPRLSPLSAKTGPTGFLIDLHHSVPKSLLRVTLASLLASCSAHAVQAANCGAAALGGGAGGPPSISATESSTTQVLEEIRRRTQLASQGAEVTPASYTEAAAPAASAASSSASSSSAAAKSVADGTSASAPPKKKVVRVASAQPSDADTYETREQSGGYERVTASWAQGYLDYEYHANIAPGQEENRSRNSRTAGGMSGTDWTWLKASGTPQAFQVGLFSGYAGTNNTFSDTNFNAYEGTANETLDNFNRTNSQQHIYGSFYGAYLAGVQGNTTYDLAFKADVFDLHQSSLLTQTNDGGACGVDAPAPQAVESGSASVNNYTLAGNVSYRRSLGGTSWLEPTAGFRYTITDYGNDPTTLTGTISNTFGPSADGRLGLEDGTVFRLQAGLRAGQQGVTPDGGLWTLVGGAFIYSDVLITGFDFNPGSIEKDNNGDPIQVPGGTTVFPVDEGKVRALGQLLTTVDYSNGWSYLMAGEIRGGEDLFGITGRLGARYTWGGR